MRFDLAGTEDQETLTRFAGTLDGQLEILPAGAAMITAYRKLLGFPDSVIGLRCL